MIISRTPLRISLCGGGTDFPDFYKFYKGKVISCAIDKYVYVIIKKRFDDLIVINYTQHETVERVSDIKHDLIRECLKLYGITKGVEITTLADIPSQGSGLGSSSAITVGLLNAMSIYVSRPQTSQTYAEQACKIEINILKRPVGKQDQFITAIGGIKQLTFNKDESVLIDSYEESEQLHNVVNNNLFLHYTDQTRTSASILTSQTNNISLNINELSELTKLTNKLDLNIRTATDCTIVGEILKDSWEIKKSLANGISNNKIDEMVSIAMNNGAIGCKISGAGGGGFLLSYVPIEHQTIFRQSMEEFKELPFNIDFYGTRIIFNII
jgi:D-glycero-alpha-D-manno-heptose-7-phosphate kinase